MKKALYYITALLFITILVSCHHHGYRTTTIVMNNDSVSLKIKYTGRIEFNADSTDISHISPEGFLEYKKNRVELIVDSDTAGHLTTNLYEKGKKIPIDDNGQKLIAEAVKEMIGQQVHTRGR